MAKEIERKFMVKDMSFKANAVAHRIVQGYICSENDRVVRVRIKGDHAYITIKNAAIGYSRDEFEYPIPVADAEVMLKDICLQPIIEKTRYVLPFGGFDWEIDCFGGINEGLIIAEIELPDEETEFQLPPFVGKEITGNPRYYNACLAAHPFTEWKEEHFKEL